MAAPAQDLKALDAAAKEKAKSLKKHKTMKRLKKKHVGENELLCIKAHAAADPNTGEHPLIALLHQCGYKNVMLIHGPTGICQAGSYRAAYQSQMTPTEDVFDVPSVDESNKALPRDHESVMKDQTNKATLDMFHELTKTGGPALQALTKIAWEKRGWKVVNKQAKDGDKGGMIACQTTKDNDLCREGYYFVNDYWVFYNDDGIADAENYYADPAGAYEVEAGTMCKVMLDKTAFDAEAIASGTTFNQETWDELCHDVLGQNVTVDEILTDHEYPNYNVKVTTEEGKTHEVPIKALRRDDDGQTALFIGEAGQWILTAELALFPEKGFTDRGKNVQPLVSEFKGILEALSQLDEIGFMEVVDPEEDEDYANLLPLIQKWCNEVGTEWSYDNW